MVELPELACYKLQEFDWLTEYRIVFTCYEDTETD